MVTAVDAAPTMVAHLADSYPAATAYVMDAQALAFPADSFDLVREPAGSPENLWSAASRSPMMAE